MARKILLPLLLLSLLWTGSGCSILAPKAGETSLDRVKRVENYYNATVRVLVIARTNGLMGDKDYEQILKLVNVGDKALDELNALAVKDPNFKLDESNFFILLNAALDQLALYSTRYDDGSDNNLGPSSRRAPADSGLRGPPASWEDHSGARRHRHADAEDAGGRFQLARPPAPSRAAA
jgi:hypothetical protein